MERSEILEFLTRMNALPQDPDAIEPDTLEFNAYRLVEDPIITNRMAVELLQKLPRDKKFDVVLASNEDSKLFAYALAMAAWARFAYADLEVGSGLESGYRIDKGDNVLIVDTFVDAGTSFEDMVDLIKDNKGKVAGAVSVVSIGDAAPLPDGYYALLNF